MRHPTPKAEAPLELERILEQEDMVSQGLGLDNCGSRDEQTTPATAALACTCHPDDNPPVPCPSRRALTECRTAALEAMIAEEIRDGISTDIHFDLVGVERVAEIIASRIASLGATASTTPATGNGEVAIVAERIAEAREYVEGLHQVAWRRMDGGQDLTRSAMIIEGLCDLLEAS